MSWQCFVVEGVHLEGPFISREKKGAHDESLILPSLAGGMDDVRRVYGRLDDTAIVTLAPELPGAVDVIRQLTSLGIVVSLGDSTHAHLPFQYCCMWQMLLSAQLLPEGSPPSSYELCYNREVHGGALPYATSVR